MFKPLSPPYIVSSLALVLQFASLLPDLTPVRVSFAIKSLATLVIRVDSRTRPMRSLRITATARWDSQIDIWAITPKSISQSTHLTSMTFHLCGGHDVFPFDCAAFTHTNLRITFISGIQPGLGKDIYLLIWSIESNQEWANSNGVV